MKTQAYVDEKDRSFIYFEDVDRYLHAPPAGGMKGVNQLSSFCMAPYDLASLLQIDKSLVIDEVRVFYNNYQKDPTGDSTLSWFPKYGEIGCALMGSRS